MIRRYDFGTPMNTRAVVRDVPVEQGCPPFFTLARQDKAVSFTLPLDADDVIFGLGETLRGVNKRGHLYRAWNMDDFSHTENKAGLYASHNLLLFFGPEKCFGVYVDDPGEVVFDLGYTRIDEAVITSVNGSFKLFVLEGESLTAICREFRGLTGRSYIPPKWAFGYIQSRWGYASDAEVRSIVAEHRTRHIPLDGVCMDIDYMDDFKDFTWNQEQFPDMQQLTRDMKQAHIRLVPIIDAGVKEQEGYDICDEGVAQDRFCKKENGDIFVGAVWPGRSYFPDFLREDVQDWFGGKYHRLLEAGIEGFWNDMNEPALFYSPETLESAYALVDRFRYQNVGIRESFALKDAFGRIANNAEDYRRFYHELDGQRVRHDKVHNLYGAMMTRSAAKGLRSFDPDKRFLLFSRSSFIGAHRDGGVWQGDNSSWWGHLLMNLKMLPSLNMCGFLYTGADLGGFSCNTTEDLLLRWLGLGVFTPLMRNHTAQHTRNQEVYRFSNWADMRNVLTVRYALVPYLYSEFMKAALMDGMYFRPLAFDYPQDSMAVRTEDQMMLGADCMIAPVYEQNARGRHVYLPEDMLMVRFRSAEDYDVQPMPAGHHWVELALNELPLFIRRGHVIPLAKGAEYVEGIDTAHLTLLGWVNGDTDLSLYDDDGLSTDVELSRGLSVIHVTVQDGCAAASVEGMDASKVLVGDGAMERKG
ncbi:MAG: TIM-barrel domain-containing protein [Aristaeellaceae bacterium]